MTVQVNSQLFKAREVLRARREELAKIPVEIQVTDSKHARSPEVVKFCIEQLSKGATYAELRRKLGLGTAEFDHRWREVRSVLVDTMAPQTEDEALKAQSSMRTYLLNKLDTFLEDVEGMLSSWPDDEESRKSIPNLLKLKLDSIRTLLEENQKEFEAFVSVRRLRTQESKTQGTSILIQNNFQINRPGDNPKDILETTKKVSGLINGDLSGAGGPRKQL